MLPTAQTLLRRRATLTPVEKFRAKTIALNSLVCTGNFMNVRIPLNNDTRIEGAIEKTLIDGVSVDCVDGFLDRTNFRNRMKRR
jgi:hypothetical protein